MGTWDVIAALGSAGGALAGAAAAGAAWRAALAAQTTSREAREALSLAIVPNVSVDLHQLPSDPHAPPPVPTRIEARVINRSQWEASQLELLMRSEDGEESKAKRERLPSFGSGSGDDWWVPLRDVTAEWPAPGVVQRLELIVRFADHRGLSRYERKYRARLERPEIDAAVSIELDDYEPQPLN